MRTLLVTQESIDAARRQMLAERLAARGKGIFVIGCPQLSCFHTETAGSEAEAIAQIEQHITAQHGRMAS